MKTKVFSFFALWLFAAASSIGFAQVWNFSADAQGWFINDVTGSGDYVDSQGTYTADWHAAGGNPGGYISHIDPSNFTFMFAAPSAQLGNYSSYIGGNLQFSEETDLTPDYSADSVVVFHGGAANLTIVSAITPQPNSTWTDYSISLTSDVFRYNNLGGATVSASDFSAVMGDLTGFMINAEYHAGVSETTGLDTVTFAAIPEPGTYALILGGTALLASFVLGRRKKSLAI